MAASEQNCNNNKIISIIIVIFFITINYQFTAQSHLLFAPKANIVILKTSCKKIKVEGANFLPGPSGCMAERSDDGT